MLPRKIVAIIVVFVISFSIGTVVFGQKAFSEEQDFLANKIEESKDHPLKEQTNKQLKESIEVTKKTTYSNSSIVIIDANIDDTPYKIITTSGQI